ncbi:hypothetical protein [Bdellovibrio sp. HCB209]|uniref:hypothetical protein n=1 Tax=Bdellovibrio sp. HCB209 TaxID=3394354 RepID=UPI0039B5EE21
MHIKVELDGTTVGVPHTITNVNIDGRDLVVSHSDVIVDGEQVFLEFDGNVPVNKKRENTKATWVLFGIILIGIDLFANSNLFLRGMLLITFVLMCGDLLASVPRWISWSARVFFLIVSLRLLGVYYPDIWEFIKSLPELVMSFFKQVPL